MTSPPGSNALELIRARARDYQVFGELGRKSDDEIWFLARREGEPALVALRLYRRTVDEWGDPVFDFDVVREVGSDVSVAQAHCIACGAQLRSFSRYCGICGADQTKGLRAGQSLKERAARLEEVRVAAEEYYEVLGEMPRAEGGGVVYFALQRSNGALVQLRLREADGELELGETRVGVQMDVSLTAVPVIPRTSTRAPRATPLGVTDPALGGPPRPAPLPEPPPPPPPEPAPAPSKKEKMLTIAVVVLAIVALIEAVLLLA